LLIIQQIAEYAFSLSISTYLTQGLALFTQFNMFFFQHYLIFLVNLLALAYHHLFHFNFNIFPLFLLFYGISGQISCLFQRKGFFGVR